ncbi:glycosyltransferase family 2 protein [Candidatus Uabimicrobium sp. HlEnr_7]|uniref:glycosyltransferase family 2 protein n=1 Tax=Candidatus Uabimicrobium helgolandensis TaxID=3095367 RepID=UPI003557436A
MSKNPVEVSVVIPVYNEEGSLQELIERLCKALQEIHFEIIIVNDGSMDNTQVILQEISAKNPKVHYLFSAQNMGQSQALYYGFQCTQGKYVVMMDGDLQNPPEDISALLSKAVEGYDLVSGERNKRKDSFILRKLPSMFANWLISRMMGCKFKDMGGINCLNGTIARRLFLKQGHHRLIPAIVHCLGGRTTEIPVSHAPRTTGVSKYGFWARSQEVILDIIMLWLTYKVKPLYFFGKVSLMFLVGSIILFLGKWLFGWHEVFAMLTAVAAILFILSGIICEFICNRKPHYIHYHSSKKLD